jgi:predicted AAA+ superfamily ATPase
MHRQIEEKLLAWKEQKRRPPLLMTGARQVGKTYAAKKFGESCFDRVAYISFDNNPRLEKIFEASVNPDELLPALTAEAGVKISGGTLLIFDEVQLIPRALTSLKYFNENRPDLAVLATGSTLGVTLHKGVQFPVGKINRLELRPLTFAEFMIALGKGELMAMIKNGDENIKAFHDKLIFLLLQYMVVGGMPLPVFEYAETKNFASVRKIQNEILKDYRDDFSKYSASVFANKLRLLWDNIPAQLSRENKKFVYGAVRKGARARDFEEAIQWLQDSSLVNMVHRIKVPGNPLRSYEEFNAFKIYVHDIGLLSAMAGVSEKIILGGEQAFREFKGALAEQFVSQELISYGNNPSYWAPENSQAEVDFVVETDAGLIIPIEVKSGINLKARSLRVYIDKYKPSIAIRSSQKEFKRSGKIIDVPLYMLAEFIKNLS